MVQGIDGENRVPGTSANDWGSSHSQNEFSVAIIFLYFKTLDDYRSPMPIVNWENYHGDSKYDPYPNLTDTSLGSQEFAQNPYFSFLSKQF